MVTAQPAIKRTYADYCRPQTTNATSYWTENWSWFRPQI